MTAFDQRWNDLNDNQPGDSPEPSLTEEERSQGWHWCMDFDLLLVGPGMEETKFCHCFDPGEEFPSQVPAEH